MFHSTKTSSPDAYLFSLQLEVGITASSFYIILFSKVFIQSDYNIHDSWVQTIHCFTIQTGVMFKVLELGEKSIQDYKIIFYSPYKMSWQSVSVAGVPKLNINHCIIEF